MRVPHANNTLDEHSKWRNGGSGPKVGEENGESNFQCGLVRWVSRELKKDQNGFGWRANKVYEIYGCILQRERDGSMGPIVVRVKVVMSNHVNVCIDLEALYWLSSTEQDHCSEQVSNPMDS